MAEEKSKDTTVQFKYNESSIKNAIKNYQDKINEFKGKKPKDNPYNAEKMKKLAPIKNKIIEMRENVLKLPNYDDSLGFVEICKKTRKLAEEVEKIDSTLSDIKVLYFREVNRMLKTMKPMRLSYLNNLYSTVQQNLEPGELADEKRDIDALEMSFAEIDEYPSLVAKEIKSIKDVNEIKKRKASMKLYVKNAKGSAEEQMEKVIRRLLEKKR